MLLVGPIWTLRGTLSLCITCMGFSRATTHAWCPTARLVGMSTSPEWSRSSLSVSGTNMSVSSSPCQWAHLNCLSCHLFLSYLLSFFSLTFVFLLSFTIANDRVPKEPTIHNPDKAQVYPVKLGEITSLQ